MFADKIHDDSFQFMTKKELINELMKLRHRVAELMTTPDFKNRKKTAESIALAS